VQIEYDSITNGHKLKRRARPSVSVIPSKGSRLSERWPDSACLLVQRLSNRRSRGAACSALACAKRKSQSRAQFALSADTHRQTGSCDTHVYGRMMMMPMVLVLMVMVARARTRIKK